MYFYDAVRSFPVSGSVLFIDIFFFYYLSDSFGELCMFPGTATQESF